MENKTPQENINMETSYSHDIEINGITYTVRSLFSSISGETVEDKIERLIKRDINAS